MSEAFETDDLPDAPLRRRRWVWRTAVGGAALLAVVLAGAWLTREDIADSLIADTLEDYDVPATYDIRSIGPSRQVIENIVVGDPAAPDMTIERAEVTIRYRFGLPTVGGMTLVRPRLFGRFADGKFSFGALDNIIYAPPSGQPFELPDMRLRLQDGRALIRSEYGNVGIKIAGQGGLRGGFTGVVGAIAPKLSDGDCTARGVSLYGKVTVRSEKPRFEGPIRLGGLQCAEADLSTGKATLALDATGSKAFDSARVHANLHSGAAVLAGNGFDSLAGGFDMSVDARGLTTGIDLAAADVELAGAAMTRLGIEGTLRAREKFANYTFDGTFTGADLTPGDGLNRQLAGYERQTEGTLLAPLIARMRTAMAREGRRSTVDGEVQARIAGKNRTVILPQARWEGASGETLVSISRGQVSMRPGGIPRLAGHFTTGGPGLPHLSGRMEFAQRGESKMQLSLAEYTADDASLAIPSLEVRQAESGLVSIGGLARASGAIPGGHVSALDLPISGSWRQGGGLTVWTRCMTPKFEKLELANLTLEGQSLMLCPPNGGAIVSSDAAGTRFAAGVPEVDLSGTLGESPATIRGGPIGFAVPGTLVASDLDITLGPDDAATRFHLSELTADIGDDIAGHFKDAEFRLADVPLDVSQAAGDWAWRDGALLVNNGAIRVTDRERDARFQPMVARDATLRFADNRITAKALLREETTDRSIVAVDIAHELESGAGHADLDVAGITFDNRLQPDTVTRLALGTVANAEGTVAGSGRIDWNDQAVTSTGTFHTNSLDFAAVFGPVRGLAGTVEFTDLLGLVTAPHQKVTIREVNPGIVVENGMLDFAIEPNRALALNGGAWPFLGGTLRMLPTRMNLGVTEVRHYVFEIEALDAGRFLERMELGNLSASGTLDGTIPLVFDQDGGRIEGGLLTARARGGNVSYVGKLTYEDMSPIANFAFDALKSLDYTGMSIGLDGSLEGEIVTRVKLDGVSQGEGAKRNFVTRRLASLPIRFDVNVRAPFYQLLSSFKSMYDPASVIDPRQLGLLDVKGNALVPSDNAVVGEDIQPSESEKM